jgi:hypothetical protein
MTIEESIHAELKEARYLVRHYRDGDTSVIGWLAGAAFVRVRAAGHEPPPLHECKVHAKRILDQEI